MFKIALLSLVLSFSILATETSDTSLERALVFYDLHLVLEKAHPQSHLLISTQIAGLKDPFEVTNSLTAGTRNFFFTNVLRNVSGQHDYLTMFAQNGTGLYVPRLFYKSASGGGWRVTPETVFYEQVKEAIFSKGLGTHYTQETKPIEEIIVHLEKIERGNFVTPLSKRQYDDMYLFLNEKFFIKTGINGSGDALEDKKSEDEQKKTGVYSYNKEIHVIRTHILEQFFALTPGNCFQTKIIKDQTGEELALAKAYNDRKAKHFYDLFENFSYPEGFLPNFDDEAVRKYGYTHALLGPTRVEVLIGQFEDKDIEWHFAYDQKGRIWIDRLSLADRLINSYGLSYMVIDSGVLTNKPLEYSHQAALLWLPGQEEGLLEDEIINFFRIEGGPLEYHDLSPLLNKLLPISEFRKTRNITRNF